MRNFDERRDRTDETREAGAHLRPVRSEEPSGEPSRTWGQWHEIQSRFVDDPREAVDEADRMVATEIDRLTGLITKDRSRLRQTWESDREASTEDLRIAMQHYRKLFDRLSLLERALAEGR